jgi:hypothetical protein
VNKSSLWYPGIISVSTSLVLLNLVVFIISHDESYLAVCFIFLLIATIACIRYFSHLK